MPSIKDYIKYLRYRYKLGLAKGLRTSDKWTWKWVTDYIRAYIKAFDMNLISYNHKKTIYIEELKYVVDENGKRSVRRIHKTINGYDLNWPWTRENIDKALFEIACGN